MVNGGDKTAAKGESISKNRAAAAFYNGNSRVKGRSELVKIRDKNSWTVVDALFIPISIPRGGGGGGFAHSFAEEFALLLPTSITIFADSKLRHTPIDFPANLREALATTIHRKYPIREIAPD